MDTQNSGYLKSPNFIGLFLNTCRTPSIFDNEASDIDYIAPFHKSWPPLEFPLPSQLCPIEQTLHDDPPIPERFLLKIPQQCGTE